MNHYKIIEQNTQEAARILRLLAHPKRLLILCRLLSGPKCVGELEKECHIGQSQLSQFLAKMKEESVLISKKKGQFVIYSIIDDRIEMIVHNIYHLFCDIDH